MLYLLLGVLLFGCQFKRQDAIVAKDGFMDLSDWDFEEHGTMEFNGEWDFYWGSLISQCSQIDSVSYAGTCRLPRFWTEVTSEGTYFEQNGAATYHMTLILPDTFNTYSLKLGAIFTSYALWEEGQLLANAGKVGLTPETTRQDFETKLVRLPKKKRLELFLQMTSWEHTRGGGIAEVIMIGKEEAIYQLWRSNFIVQIFSFAIISGVSLYLIVLAFFYPEDPSYLYVGLFALLGAIRAICVEEMVIESLIDDFPYYWNQRLRYIGFFASIGFIVLAVNEFFKGYLPKYIKYGPYGLFVYSVLMLFMPFSWTSYLSPFFQVVTVILTLFCFWATVRTIRDEKNIREATIFMFGGGVVFITMVH